MPSSSGCESKNHDIENLTSLTLINDLPQDYDFKFVAVYKDSHIFLAEGKNNSNDVFHYIRDANVFVLLFKHDYSEFGDLEEDNVENIKIKDMKMMEEVDTLLILYSNGNLKSFNIPDLIYNFKSDLQNIKQIETVDEDRCMILDSVGDMSVYRFGKSNSPPKQQNYLRMNNIKKFTRPIYEKANGLCFLVLNNNFECILVSTKLKNKEALETKSLVKYSEEFISSGLEIFMIKLNNNRFLITKYNHELQANIVLIEANGDVVNEFALNRNPTKVADISAEKILIGYEGEAEILALNTNELISSTQHIYSTAEIDNCLFLSWDIINSSAKGKLFLDALKAKYLPKPLIRDINGNQITIDVQIEQENLFIEKNYGYKGKILLLCQEHENRASLECLLEAPITNKLQTFDSKTIALCDEVISQLSGESIKEFNKLQIQYARYYKLLLELFHNECIDVHCFNNWVELATCKDSTLDPKLLFYILNWKVYGDVWISNGLLRIIEKLKILKLESKIENQFLFLSNILDLLKNDKKTKQLVDLFHLKKTVTLKFVENVVIKDRGMNFEEIFKNVDLELFADDIIDYVGQKDESLNKTDILLYLHEKRQDYSKLMDILIETQNYKRLDQTITQNFKEISAKQDKSLFLKQLVILINNVTDLNSNLLKSVNNYINKDVKDFESLKNFVNNLTNKQIKFYILENIVKNSSRTIDLDTLSFTVDFYVLEIETVTLKNEHFNKVLRYELEDFKKDLDFKNKSSINEYCNAIVQKETNVNAVRKKWLDLITAINSSENSKQYRYLLENKFSTTFGGNMIVFFIFDMSYVLPKQEEFESYLKYNDFKSINIALAEDDSSDFNVHFLIVLTHYQDNELIFLKFMNLYSLNISSDMFLKIVDLIPHKFKLKLLKEFALKNITQLEIAERMLNLNLSLYNFNHRE